MFITAGTDWLASVV